MDHYSQPSSAAAASEAAGGDEKGKDARRNLMREKRKKALKHLSVPERDVLTVLSAVCKVRNLVSALELACASPMMLSDCKMFIRIGWFVANTLMCMHT